jgi:hypothetical protein
VLDVDGLPRAHARVVVDVQRYELGHTYTTIGPAYELETDADGCYGTPPLPVGHLSLRVRVSDRQLAYLTRPILPGDEEALEPIRLHKDVPVIGKVQDEAGRPIAGAAIRANDVAQTTSDAAGRFTLHGFGPDPRFQMVVWRDGFVHVNWAVSVRKDGLRWTDVSGLEDGPKELGPAKDLTVVLKPLAWIEGRALDADTGEPIRLRSVVLCQFERKPDGEIIRRG